MCRGSASLSLQYILGLLVGCMMGAVTALSPAQRQSLAGARDGQDFREPAFDALVGNVRAWTAPRSSSGPAEEARPLDDSSALSDRPEHARGVLFRVVGELQQQSPLEAPHQDVVEWFVRDDQGVPVIVYVVGLDRRQRYHDGQRIQIDARLYKSIDALARDGRLRRYAAFVGAHPQHLPVPSKAMSTTVTPNAWPAVGALGLLLLAFVILLARIRRARRSFSELVRPRGPDRAFEPPSDGMDTDAPLPDDPAEALSELQRRARAD